MYIFCGLPPKFHISLLYWNLNMGSVNQPNHLLITVPFPEPKEAVEALRKKHPQWKVTYLEMKDPNPMSGKHDIPDGTKSFRTRDCRTLNNW